MDKKVKQQIIKALNRAPRFHNRTYEKRALINGIEIYACAPNAEECYVRFMDRLSQKIFENSQLNEKIAVKLPSNFHEFAMYFFENVRQQVVVEQTYYTDLNRYKNHIKPHFGKLSLRNITPEYCQKLIDKLTAAGIEKTRDEIVSLLNGIFNFAVDRGTLVRNPMKTVVYIPHESENGVPLTIEEEEKLFNITANTEYQLMFAIALYTGMRPNEFRTAHFDENDKRIIVAKNSKRKNAKRGKIQWKRIPVCPMLAPFLANVPNLDMYTAETMRGKFKKLFPNHQLKDLRATFYTRCETCKIDDKARDAMVGHEKDKLHKSYSKLPDTFLIEEANKINYSLNIIIAPKFAPKKNRFALAEKLKNSKNTP